MNNNVYIIAEVGPNHNGDIGLALEMVEKIAATGVDAVKFQMTDPYMLIVMIHLKHHIRKKMIRLRAREKCLCVIS